MIAKLDVLFANLNAKRERLAWLTAEQLEELESLVTDRRDNYSDEVIEDENLALVDMVMKVTVHSTTCIELDEVYGWIQDEGEWISVDDLDEDEIVALVPEHIRKTWE